MHEFIHNDEKIIKVGEPIFFENKTEWIPVTERNKVNDLISRQDAIDADDDMIEPQESEE